MPQIIQTEDFINDLQPINAYLKLHYPSRLKRFTTTLKKKILALNIYPQLYQMVHKIRYFVVLDYVVLYEFDKKTDVIILLNIWHGSRVIKK